VQYFIAVEKDPWAMLICATEMRSLVRLKPRNGEISSQNNQLLQEPPLGDLS
jgi:hypothetical protein